MKITSSSSSSSSPSHIIPLSNRHAAVSWAAPWPRHWPPRPVITTVTCTPPTVTPPVLVLYQPCFGFHPSPALRLLVRSFPDSSSPASDNVGLSPFQCSVALYTQVQLIVLSPLHSKCNGRSVTSYEPRLMSI